MAYPAAGGKRVWFRREGAFGDAVPGAAPLPQPRTGRRAGWSP